MNSWSRKVNGETLIHRDELRVILAALKKIRRKHDELKHNFLKPEPKLERATKAETLPPNKELPQLLAHIRRNTRDVFYMSFMHLDTWTSESFQYAQELFRTPQ